MDRDTPLMVGAGLAEALELRPGDLVSLVGAGGKTTLMYRLLAELRGSGWRVAAATTTKIGRPGPGDGVALVCASTYEEAREALVKRHGAPVLGQEVLGSGKIRGIPPEWCDRLLYEGLVDVLIVEADGSARKPLKAPAEWEPVVPAATTAFVAVVGLSSLGEVLDEGVVFRPELVALASGFAVGAPITAELVAALLAAPEGLLRGCPPAARPYAFLNQADTPDRAEAAVEVGRRLLEGSVYRRVVTAALRQTSPVKRVAARPAVR